MSDCNVILKDRFSRLLAFPHLSGSLVLLRPRCCCWSVLITKLWGSDKGEVLQSFLGIGLRKGPRTAAAEEELNSGAIRKALSFGQERKAIIFPHPQQPGVSRVSQYLGWEVKSAQTVQRSQRWSEPEATSPGSRTVVHTLVYPISHLSYLAPSGLGPANKPLAESWRTHSSKNS